MFFSCFFVIAISSWSLYAFHHIILFFVGLWKYHRWLIISSLLQSTCFHYFHINVCLLIFIYLVPGFYLVPGLLFLCIYAASHFIFHIDPLSSVLFFLSSGWYALPIRFFFKCSTELSYKRGGNEHFLIWLVVILAALFSTVHCFHYLFLLLLIWYFDYWTIIRHIPSYCAYINVFNVTPSTLEVLLIKRRNLL